MSDERQHVFVIMSNDYPCRVYADRDAADGYVASMNEESKRMKAAGLNRRIYYRSYEFEVLP